MQRLLVIAAVAATAGCELYFEQDPDEGADARRVDAPPFPITDAPPPDAPACTRIAYCGGDGSLYQTGCLPGAPDVLPEDVYLGGATVGRCPSGACQDDSTFMPCPGGVCTGSEAALCRPVGACELDGRVCGIEGTCGAAAVAAMLQGRWVGTVTPPQAFAEPYTGTLVFRGDGSYVADGTGANPLFYYGADGTSPVYRWRAIGTNAGGGIATVDV